MPAPTDGDMIRALIALANETGETLDDLTQRLARERLVEMGRLTA